MRAGALKSRLRVYAPKESAGRLASVEVVWEERETIWGGFQSPERRLRTYGAGEVPVGRAMVEVRSSACLQPRDGIEVLSGPERGTRWRVVSVDRSNRTQFTVLLEPFSGSFA